MQEVYRINIDGKYDIIMRSIFAATQKESLYYYSLFILQLSIR